MQVVMWLRSPVLVSSDKLVGPRLQEGPVLHDGEGSMMLRGDAKPSLRILVVGMRCSAILAWLRDRVSSSLPVRCSCGEAFSVAALYHMDVPFGTFVAF